MKQIVVISGKGGTGKTIITGSFASLAKNNILADCDVDAADLHLLLNPKVKEKHEFKSGKTAFINQDKCIKCGKCMDVCRFDAINLENSHDKRFKVDPVSCEGCGVCSHICPVGAIDMNKNLSGHWFISKTKYGDLIHAKLGIAEENSGKLVSLVRQTAKEVAERDNKDYVIIDGSPGIGCPVIASLSGTDLALIITEPTLSGIHDLDRILQVTKHFGIKAGCVINKYDLNLENTKEIKKFLKMHDIEFFGKIHFSKEVSNSIAKGIPLVEYTKSPVSSEIKGVWNKVRVSLE